MERANENRCEVLRTSRFIPNPEESLFDPEDAIVGGIGREIVHVEWLMKQQTCYSEEHSPGRVNPKVTNILGADETMSA